MSAQPAVAMYRSDNFWVINAHRGDQIVAPAQHMRFATLIEAAKFLHAHYTGQKRNGTAKRVAFFPQAVVYNTATSERWEWIELFDGGYLDDFLNDDEYAMRRQRAKEARRAMAKAAQA